VSFLRFVSIDQIQIPQEPNIPGSTTSLFI